MHSEKYMQICHITMQVNSFTTLCENRQMSQIISESVSWSLKGTVQRSMQPLPQSNQLIRSTTKFHAARIQCRHCNSSSTATSTIMQFRSCILLYCTAPTPPSPSSQPPSHCTTHSTPLQSAYNHSINNH